MGTARASHLRRRVRQTRMAHIAAPLALLLFLAGCGGGSSGGTTASDDSERLDADASCALVLDRVGVLAGRIGAIDTESPDLGGQFTAMASSFRQLEGDLDRPTVDEAAPMMTAFRERARAIAESSERLGAAAPRMLAAPARIEALGPQLEAPGDALGPACRPATDACRQVVAALEGMDFTGAAMNATVSGLEAVEPGPSEGALRDVIAAYLVPLRELRDLAVFTEQFSADLDAFNASVRAFVDEPPPEGSALCDGRTSGGES